jgi:hypothetical protein
LRISSDGIPPVLFEFRPCVVAFYLSLSEFALKIALREFGKFACLAEGKRAERVERDGKLYPEFANYSTEFLNNLLVYPYTWQT